MEILKFLVPILLIVAVYFIVRRFTTRQPVRSEVQAARLLLLTGAAGFFLHRFVTAEGPWQNGASLGLAILFFGSAVVVLNKYFIAKS